MSSSLLWLKTKIAFINKKMKERYEKRKRSREMSEIQYSPHHISDHIKRDIGLPPYDSSNKYDL